MIHMCVLCAAFECMRLVLRFVFDMWLDRATVLDPPAACTIVSISCPFSAISFQSRALLAILYCYIAHTHALLSCVYMYVFDTILDLSKHDEAFN